MASASDNGAVLKSTAINIHPGVATRGFKHEFLRYARAMLPLLIVLGAVGFVSVLSSLRVLREYERAIVFRLGRARKEPLGPGLVLMLPWGIDRAQVVDTRTKVIQIPSQE